MIIYPMKPGERLACQRIGAAAVTVSISWILASVALSVILGCL